MKPSDSSTRPGPCSCDPEDRAYYGQAPCNTPRDQHYATGDYRLNTAEVARHAARFIAEHPMHGLEAVEGSFARAAHVR